MEKLKIKLRQMQHISIWKAGIILILLALILLIVINQQNLQFYFNNFGQIVRSDLRVYFLDVGQASATLIIMPTGDTLLIDTGSPESAENFVADVKNLLHKNNLSEIDMLILSHPDSDHVGGTVALMDVFQVNSVLRPKVLSYDEISDLPYIVSTTYTYASAIESIYAEPNCDVRFVENEILLFGDASMEISAARYLDYGDDTNSFSPYIILTYEDRTFLFTGDAPEVRETEFLAELAAQKRTLSVDFFQVAHHGSKYSTSPNFLSALSPKYAFISAGDRTHPTQTVFNRLKDVGVEETFVTKNDGLIAVGVKVGGTFVICTMHGFVDVPVLVILLSCIIFVIMRFSGIEVPYQKPKQKY